MLSPTIVFAVFFPLFFPVPWLLNDHNTAKKWFLVAVSYVFYAFWRADFTLILLTSSVVNFALALLIGRCRERPARLALLWLRGAVHIGGFPRPSHSNFFSPSASYP